MTRREHWRRPGRLGPAPTRSAARHRRPTSIPVRREPRSRPAASRQATTPDVPRIQSAVRSETPDRGRRFHRRVLVEQPHQPDIEVAFVVAAIRRERQASSVWRTRGCTSSSCDCVSRSGIRWSIATSGSMVKRSHCVVSERDWQTRGGHPASTTANAHRLRARPRVPVCRHVR